MKIWKILIRIGVVLLAVVAAGLLVRAVLNYTEGRALTRTLAELKAQGIPLTAKDLAPPCPDEDNGARLWKAYVNITTIPTQMALSSRPHPPRAAEVRGLIARAWRGYTSGKPLAPADRAALKDEILKNAKAFELIAEMGDKPCFLSRDPAQSLAESRFEAVQMIQTTELLFFSALFSAEEGDVHGAVDTLLTGLKFTPLAAGEGTLIACLVSVAETRVLAQFLGEICGGRAVEDEDLVRLMRALDPGPWGERLAAAFRGERVMFVEVGEDLLGSGLGDLGSIYEGSSWWQKFGLWVLRPLLKVDMRRSLPSFEFLEAQAKIPYYQSRDALKGRDQQLEGLPWYAYLSKFMLPNSEGAFMKKAMIEAVTLASRTGLACRLYKRRSGRYPGSLDELVPGLLAEVPIDPFTGKPLVYRREGEGFVVYSLGSNQKDDGGRSTYMIDKLVMDKDDDWTWKEDR
jgi:hypothetical protein